MFSDKKSFSNKNCGGFIVEQVKSVNNHKYVAAYGMVKSCRYNAEAPHALIRFYNKNLKVVDSIFADAKGNYKLELPEGTYKIKAMQISSGIIETPFIDFFSGKSLNIDLFLGDLPSIKD